MKKTTTLICFVILSVFNSSASNYTLNLHPDNWKIDASKYFIKEVRDNRVDKNNGKVLMDGKLVNALFKESLQLDIFNLINQSINFDTSGIPIILFIDKFKLNETGTISKHKATLNFTVHFSTEIDNEEYKLFNLSGVPEIMVKGSVAEVHEKNIYSSFKQAFENFNKWIHANLNIAPFARRVEIVFIKDTLNDLVIGDTIQWSKNYQLKWDDFQGKVPASDFSAQSNCSFMLRIEKVVDDRTLKLQIKFFAAFIKPTSWVKPDLKRDTLLIHEQYHFNICEMYARQFKKKLLDFDFHTMKTDQQIKVIFDEVWAEYKQAQEDYDNETEHGMIIDQQLKWISKVDESLRIGY